MIRITYPDNNTTQKKYDELGRLIQTTDANGKVEKLYYDGNNNQIRATDRNGTELSYVYDARNFLIEKKAPDESIRYAYDLAGRRTRMTDNTGTTQYTYQPSTGQLSKVVYPDGKTLAYDYNALGLRSSLNDPSGQNTYYQYDSRNRLSSVSSSLADEEAAYSYYRNDLIKQTRQRSGITTAYTYNGLQLQTLTHKQADGTALNTYAYEYDANENETAKTENGQTYQFGYDPLNRITSSSQYRESYAYDARGNRTSFQTNHEVSSPDADYVYDKKDRLSTVKLKDGSTVSYKYNGDGLLYERTDKDGTARYYYDGDQVIAEGDGSGSLKARYVRGRELVARESGGSKAYYLHNGHGDVVELRSETGTRLNQYAYGIWGNPTVSEENISNPFRYSGEYWDSATKLQYLRARWYDPSMGRFINEGTYEGQLDNPLSLNLYTYVENNPLTHVDPSGHSHVGVDAGGASSIITVRWNPTITANWTINEMKNKWKEAYDKGGDYKKWAKQANDLRVKMINSGISKSEIMGVDDDAIPMSIVVSNAKISTATWIKQDRLGFGLLADAYSTVVPSLDSVPIGNLSGPKINIWNKGSFDSPLDSANYHFGKHGKKVGASDLDQYLRKAEGFSQNLRGASKSNVNGAVEGVIRYKKNGKYIDIAPDGTIVSYGKQ
ncbi:RHS repeat domain-containing protein [Paenibacillus chitinolyticus]